MCWPLIVRRRKILPAGVFLWISTAKPLLVVAPVLVPLFLLVEFRFRPASYPLIGIGSMGGFLVLLAWIFLVGCSRDEKARILSWLGSVRTGGRRMSSR